MSSAQMMRIFLSLIGIVLAGFTALVAFYQREDIRAQTKAANKAALVEVYSMHVTTAIEFCEGVRYQVAIELANIVADEIEEYHEDKNYTEQVKSLSGRLKTHCSDGAGEFETLGDNGALLSGEANGGFEEERFENLSDSGSMDPLTLEAELGSGSGPVRGFVSMSTLTTNLEVQRKEDREPVPPTPAGAAEANRAETISGVWMAVLASYADGEEGFAVERLAKERARAADLNIEIYRTSISGHYALVSAPADGREASAQALVRYARERGVARDAFPQVARRWRLCAQPTSVEGLKACAAAVGN